MAVPRSGLAELTGSPALEDIPLGGIGDAELLINGRTDRGLPEPSRGRLSVILEDLEKQAKMRDGGQEEVFSF